VKGMHAKDGLYPTNPKDLGKQVPMGQGKVDFPALIRRLKELNYLGPVTIEQEFTTSDALEELRRERAYLEKLISG